MYFVVKLYLKKDDYLKLSINNLVSTKKNMAIYFEKLLPSVIFQKSVNTFYDNNIHNLK